MSCLLYGMHAFSRWLSQHDKLSGWAQFLGAVIGVVIAIAVPMLQQRNQRKSHQGEIADRVDVLGEMLRAGVYAVDDLFLKIEDAEKKPHFETTNIHIERYKALLDASARVELSALPSARTVGAWIEGAHRLEDLVKAVEVVHTEIKIALFPRERSKEDLLEARNAMLPPIDILRDESIRIRAREISGPPEPAPGLKSRPQKH